MEPPRPYQPNESYLRVATASPEVAVANVASNIKHITALYQEATAQAASLVVFPEMSVTGYTLGDLVEQRSLLEQAEAGLARLAAETRDHQTAMVVGLPLRVGNSLFNCAAVLAEGVIKGIVPKQNLPTYDEFYENRWYQTWQHPRINLEVGDQTVPFGNDLLFNIGGVRCGVEICEDLWVTNSPSNQLAEQGGLVFANPSASPEQIGKADYRRDLVRVQSGKLIAGYLYAGSHWSESTAEIVMSGHQMIASNSHLEAEHPPFSGNHLLVADIDIDHLEADRRKRKMATKLGAFVVHTALRREQTDLLARIQPHPFLPHESAEARHSRLDMAVQIQAHGLAMRLRTSHQERVVLGLSGGLDSTLALLAAYEAARILGRDPADMIHTITMPGQASSEHTQTNAQQLAAALGVPNRVIPIHELVDLELTTLGHDGHTQDITYENTQARARSNLLFNYANMHRALQLGTGDLTEIALGWCTYNADQQSHYHVNGGVPKTLVRHLVAHLAEQPRYAAARELLASIIATPISPELTSDGRDGISQSTEDIIGPFELHEFFYYHLLRWGDKPAKIIYLTERAFRGTYDRATITKWFGVFINRFPASQFKRETMPNSPKMGSVSLSPRGDWRMPPDLYNVAIWN